MTGCMEFMQWVQSICDVTAKYGSFLETNTKIALDLGTVSPPVPVWVTLILWQRLVYHRASTESICCSTREHHHPPLAYLFHHHSTLSLQQQPLSTSPPPFSFPRPHFAVFQFLHLNEYFEWSRAGMQWNRLLYKFHEIFMFGCLQKDDEKRWHH